MIRDERWKLNLYHTAEGEEGELFDMKEDPRETANRWLDSSAAPHLKRLRGELARWYEKYRDGIRQGSRGGESRLSGKCGS